MNKWRYFREKIVFAKNEKDFCDGVEELLKEGELDTVKEVYVDLNSYLPKWTLDKHVAASVKEAGSQQLRRFLEAKGDSDVLGYVDSEITSIQNSQITQMCDATAAGKLNSFWGHDLCYGIEYSLRRGVLHSTCNPAKVNQFRVERPALWQQYLDEVHAECGDKLNPDEMISRLTIKVVKEAALDQLPLYDATDEKLGVAFSQVNPRNWQNPEKMVEEVLFWYDSYQKILGRKRPNVVFKMPAVPATAEAIPAIRKANRDIRMCMTVNFGMKQHDVFSALLSNADRPNFLVYMEMQDRMFIKEELMELYGLTESEALPIAIHAGGELGRLLYWRLKEKKSDCIMQIAGVRDEYTIYETMTDEKEYPCCLTMTPEMCAQYDSAPRETRCYMHDTMDPREVAMVERCQTYIQARYPSEFPWDNIYEGFKPMKFQLGKFLASYEELAATKF